MYKAFKPPSVNFLQYCTASSNNTIMFILIGLNGLSTQSEHSCFILGNTLPKLAGKDRVVTITVSTVLSGLNLTFSPPTTLPSAEFPVCFNVQSASVLFKVGKMLSKYPTAWMRMGRRATRRLIWIQYVCI